jgi:hypothetical protein
VYELDEIKKLSEYTSLVEDDINKSKKELSLILSSTRNKLRQANVDLKELHQKYSMKVLQHAVEKR